MNRKNLTTRQLLQMVETKIKTGQIKVDEDFYGHGVGLSGQDYEFRFPDSWDNPQCYRIVVDPNGEQREDKEWGNLSKTKKVKSKTKPPYKSLLKGEAKLELDEETKKVLGEFVKKAQKHKTNPQDFSQTIICGREEFAETKKNQKEFKK